MALTTTLEKKQNQTLSKSIEAQTTVEAALEALSNNKLNKTSKAVSSNTADKLANTTAIGSTIKPVYFTDKGVPAACTYKLEKDVPSNAVFTDTHHKTYLYVTGSTGTTNAQTSNGATHLRLFDETTNRSTIKITGTGATKVSSDSHGVITINSTDNNTTYSAGTGLSLGGSNNAFSVKTGYTTDATARNYKVTTDSSGNLYVNVPWTDTVYTHPTGSGNKHIPSGGSSGQILRWSADGTATWGSDNDTKYSAGTGLSLNGTTFSVKTGYTTSGRNYKVTTDSSGNLYVNVPWTDTKLDLNDINYDHGSIINVGSLDINTGITFDNNGTIQQLIELISPASDVIRRSINLVFTSVKQSGAALGKVNSLMMTANISKTSNSDSAEYLLVGYFKVTISSNDKRIYKLYIGLSNSIGGYQCDAFKCELYGTF